MKALSVVFLLGVIALVRANCPGPFLEPTTQNPPGFDFYTVKNYDIQANCTDRYNKQCCQFCQYAPSTVFFPPFSNNLKVGTDNTIDFTVPPGFNGATFIGTVFEGDESNPTQTWAINVTFTGWQPTCVPGNTLEELLDTCYVADGGFINPACFQCFANFTGTLTALTGKFHGVTVSITRQDTHTPQIGTGADGKDCKFGLSFWFTWYVQRNSKNCDIPSTTEKHADVNCRLWPPNPPRPPQIKGDPHFVGFDGSKFDFHGEPDKVFNIISDANMQMNALFVSADKIKKTKTYLGSVGIKVGENRLHIGCDRKNSQQYMLLNGVPLSINEVYSLDEGSVALDREGKVNIDLPDYFFKIRFSSSAHSSCHINLRATYKSYGSTPSPHGILGQTANKDREVSDSVAGGMNGEGYVEGTMTDYLLQSGDIFGSDFSFNLFRGESTAEVSKRSDNKQRSFMSGYSH